MDLMRQQLIERVGETVSSGLTASGDPYVLTIQSALPSGELPVGSQKLDAALVKQAQQSEGVVPDDLVPLSTTEPMPYKEQYAKIDPELNDQQMKPVFGYATTSSGLSLAWTPVEGAFEYVISVDGKVVKTTNGLVADYTNLAPDTEYHIQVDAVAKDGTSVSTRMLPITLLSEPYDSTVSRSFQPHNLALTYKTFIADNLVSLGFMETLGCGFAGATDNPQFGGDNRSWRYPNYLTPNEPRHYRTMMFTNINWGNPPEYSVIYGTDIAPTTLYKNGVFSESKTAAGTITPSNAYRSGSYAQIHFAHSVGNPYCAAGAITYNATFRFYQSGTIEVAGSRYPVPHHEIYGRWNPNGTERWYSMMQAANEGFGCLTGYCTNPGIALSVNR